MVSLVVISQVTSYRARGDGLNLYQERFRLATRPLREVAGSDPWKCSNAWSRGTWVCGVLGSARLMTGLDAL